MSPEVVSRAIKSYFEATRAMDKEAWVNTFAEDAISYDPVGALPIRGHQKLAEFFDSIVGDLRKSDSGKNRSLSQATAPR
jgi:steroid Delta-isomerase